MVRVVFTRHRFPAEDFNILFDKQHYPKNSLIIIFLFSCCLMKKACYDVTLIGQMSKVVRSHVDIKHYPINIRWSSQLGFLCKLPINVSH